MQKKLLILLLKSTQLKEILFNKSMTKIKRLSKKLSQA